MPLRHPPSFCSVRYESSWILWYVCCYASIFSRWISSCSTAGYLILFLFLKMNLWVPYSQLSSVVWAVLDCLLLGYHWLSPIHLSLMSVYRTWERGQLKIIKSVYVTCMHVPASLHYYLKKLIKKNKIWSFSAWGNFCGINRLQACQFCLTAVSACQTWQWQLWSNERNSYLEICLRVLSAYPQRHARVHCQ